MDEREILTSFRIAGQIEFPYLEQVFRITRKSEEVKTGKRSEQTIYGITSVSVEEFGAEELLELTRNHWQVETANHIRDWTLKEDKMRSTQKTVNRLMAEVRSLAIAILSQTNCQNKKARLENFSDDFDNLIITLKILNFL